MNNDLPYIGIHGYDGGTSNDPRKFVSIRDEEGNSNWVQIGAETPNGYKIAGFDEKTNTTRLEHKGNTYYLPMFDQVNKTNEYKPKWNEPQIQYSDALSFNDIQGLAKFKKENDTFNSMLQDVTGMSSFKLDIMKRLGGGALTDHEQKMLGSYNDDPALEIPNEHGVLPKQKAVMIWDNTNGYEHNEQRLNKILESNYSDEIKHSAKQGLEYLKQMKTSESPELGFTRPIE